MRKVESYIMGTKFNKNEMDKLEEILSKFLVKFNITLIPPVDIFELANNIGFDVRAVDFPDRLDGMLLVNENISSFEEFTSNKVIAYNVNKDIEDKKFIVAHELAHYIEEKVKNFDKRIVVAARDHKDTYSIDIEEQQMDYIAASILVPKNNLLSEIKGVDITKEFCSKMAQHYNVAYELMRRRIEEVQSCL